MSSKRSCWEIYNKQMSQLNNGDALWEPAPLHYFKRIHPGDVGYIRRGCFHLLFSAGRPQGERRLGVHVPRSFKQLEVGPIFNTQPRLPGHLSTNSVRETRARLAPSTSPDPILEPGSSFSFQLTEDQGAALVTKYLTHREDVQLAGTFEKYAKDHYDSWVAFARETGHGNDVKPVLVTGVDMTRDFAMMSYSNNDDNLISEFTTSAPGAGSVWGTWRTTGSVNTNCGPYLSHPPSPTQTIDSSSSGTGHTSTIPDEYNQCVFVRYYTVRKRLGIPRVIRAAAGPHDLGPGDRDNEESLLEEQYDSGSDSDSDSDIASSLFDDDDDDSSSVSSVESESNIAIHNTTPDERGDFDEVADYIFRNSDADSVLIHHRDIALLRQPGDNTDLYTQLLEKRPAIAVDENGVGKIVPEPGPSTNISSYDPLGITQPTLSSTPSKTEHGATNEMGSPEPQSSPRLNWPQQNVSPSTQEVSIVVNPSIRERAPHPPPGESYEGADSVQPRENWNITIPRTISPLRRHASPESLSDTIAPENQTMWDLVTPSMGGPNQDAPAPSTPIPFLSPGCDQPIWCSPAADESHPSYLSSSTELAYDLFPPYASVEWGGFTDYGAAGRPYETTIGACPLFQDFLDPLVFSNEVDVLGNAYISPHPPTDMAGDQGAVQVPEELLPVGVNSFEVQRPSRRGWSVSLDGRHPGKRVRFNVPESLEEQTQAISTPLPPYFTSWVPQAAYQSQDPDWRPLPPIHFTALGEGGRLEGINLEDVLDNRYRCFRLDVRSDPVFEDESIRSTILCRLNFAGYHMSEHKARRQISIKNHKTHDRITRQELAHDVANVAKFVKDYLESGEAPFHIPFGDMFLTKLHHVARESLWPELWYIVRPSASSSSGFCSFTPTVLSHSGTCSSRNFMWRAGPGSQNSSTEFTRPPAP